IERLEHERFVAHAQAAGAVLESALVKAATEEADRTAAGGLLVGGWYRLADDVDRLGVPTDTDWVVVMGLPTAHGAGKVEVAWPHITAGPLHTRAIIPAHHLTGDAHDGPPEDAP